MNNKEWKEEFEKRRNKVSKEHPYWPKNKVNFVVTKGMPKMDNGGWEE